MKMPSDDTLIPHQPSHSLRRRLEAKQSSLIDQANLAGVNGDGTRKLDRERRAELIKQSLLSLRRPIAIGASNRTVFVSYSKQTGAPYVEILQKFLAEKEFCCITGFDSQVTANQSILHRVMKKLREASFFVGILTNEYEVVDEHGKPYFAPSVWVVEEKGMALYRSLPCYFLVEEGIHMDWLTKTTPGKRHYTFTSKTFADSAREAVSDMDQRHKSMIRRFMT